ncbi:hypothetical protein EVAR_64491_1 [Eumeta japonica]|uniref:Uncharacterized protein n=1 Tax=Eumeta variegata TaxID=151549 RepID=A0A4C2AAG4_EUMVA|nr:hypothetical protein EVAR_64491_1 [Eumeta japonica]
MEYRTHGAVFARVGRCNNVPSSRLPLPKNFYKNTNVTRVATSQRLMTDRSCLAKNVSYGYDFIVDFSAYIAVVQKWRENNPVYRARIRAEEIRVPSERLT